MTETTYTAQVSQSGETGIEVRRRFAAPRNLVFRAFTDPELMQRWLLGPPGWTMTVCEMDLRVGGAYRWQWKNTGDGTYFGLFGTFLEVVVPERLVETQTYDPGTLGGEKGPPCTFTLSFDDLDGETQVTTRIVYATPEARQAALDFGMTAGMEQSYQALDALIPDVSG
ncbi:ATPase [Rhodophyticola sp. CCM32]|uniref:SRPBCC family protein n=1 Tax=Rhodophyticola sp. CCM32 TaxID=2916397 RepID=UPI00107F8E48|nr:SRPBCC family protein [Rhodophyticola sp. CCM32]QBY00704.1 ATPase [Rhodophyticola sp. CCM32]